MSSDELFDCEAFKAITNGSGGGFDQGIADIADKREEYASQYGRVTLNATVGQINYILLLLKDGWLDKSDFTTSHEFHRKKSMSMARANELIRLGKKRKDENRHWKTVAKERDW